MCGIAGAFGAGWSAEQLEAMVAAQRHRGPDACGTHLCPSGVAALGHARLSIIDRSDAGRQPMSDASGRRTVVFNGEIYNYLELRDELRGYPFRTRTDTEVLLAAYDRWGEACLDRLVGMFAFLLWDGAERRLLAARDRFGVKPLYYHLAGDALLVASEVTALHAAGVGVEPDESSWASYLAHGLLDHSVRTFWDGIVSLPAGHVLTWRSAGNGGRLDVRRWYDLAARVGPELDGRPVEVVQEEYLSLLEESVRLRFRSDVPVGVNLSGGLDSSTLLGLVQATQGTSSTVSAFTFVTGDPAYDELPWVERMLARTRHPLVPCALGASDVPALTESLEAHLAEPFGGVPTLAYARLFERARELDVPVLLDGQGMDEQWAGYDYYAAAPDDRGNGAGDVAVERLVQGGTSRAVRPECLAPEFAALATPLATPAPFGDRMRDLQYRDACLTKIPRALRYNDRVSMRSSIELREPFLDHRLFELALRQPADRRIRGGTRKWLLRRIAAASLPVDVVEAPKRPVQTPQREWLRGPLHGWATERIRETLRAAPHWFDADAVLDAWRSFGSGEGDNSFFAWQWLGVAPLLRCAAPTARPTAIPRACTPRSRRSTSPSAIT